MPDMAATHLRRRQLDRLFAAVHRRRKFSKTSVIELIKQESLIMGIEPPSREWYYKRLKKIEKMAAEAKD